jgi:AraC-like DNA-binding protein
MRRVERQRLWAEPVCINRHHFVAELDRRLRRSPGSVPSDKDLAAVFELRIRDFRRECVKVLGMSAARYFQQRRLAMAHKAFQRSGLASVRVEEVARRFGFEDSVQFATTYSKLFGLPSSATQKWKSRRRSAVGNSSAATKSRGGDRAKVE